MSSTRAVAVLCLITTFYFTPTIFPEEVLAQESTSAQRGLNAQEVRLLAMEQNPDLEGFRIELQRAELLLEREETTRVPTFVADGSYRFGQTPFLSPDGTRLIDSSSLSFGTRLFHTFAYGTQLGISANLGRAARDSVELGELGIAWDTRLGVDVAQPLLRGFGPEIVDANIRSAQESLDAATLQERSRASAVLREVLSSYWDLWMAQQALEIQEEALSIAERNLTNAEIRLQAGTISRADIISLRAEVSSARERVMAAQSRIRQESTTLGQQLGLRTGEALVATEQALPAPRLLSYDEALMAYKEYSPEYQRQLSTIRSTRIQAQLAHDNSRPRLDATGAFFIDGLDRGPGDAFVQMARVEGWVASLGLRLELPINNRSRLAEAERADLAISAAESELRRLESAEAARISNLIEEISAAQSRVELAQEAADLARESVDAQTARYEAGRATTFEVIDAIYRLEEAQLRVLEIEASILQQILNLEHITGLLL